MGNAKKNALSNSLHFTASLHGLSSRNPRSSPMTLRNPYSSSKCRPGLKISLKLRHSFRNVEIEPLESPVPSYVLESNLDAELVDKVMKDVAEEINEFKDMDIEAIKEIKETSYAIVKELCCQTNHETDMCPGCEGGSQPSISSDTVAAEYACQVFDKMFACKVFGEIPVHFDDACHVFEEIHAFNSGSNCSQKKTLMLLVNSKKSAA